MTDVAGVVIYEVSAINGDTLKQIHEKAKVITQEIVESQVLTAMAISATANIKIRVIVT